MKKLPLILLSALFIFSIQVRSQEVEEVQKSPEEIAQENFESFTKSAREKCDSAQNMLDEKVDEKTAKKNKKIADKLIESAIEDYLSAIEIDPNSYAAYFLLGKTYMKLNNFKKAIPMYTKAIYIDSTKNEIFRERAMAKIAKGDLQLAVYDLDTAININYDDYEAFYQRGVLMEKSGKMDEAINNYERALEIKPDFSKPYFRRALITFNVKKDYILANEDILKAYKADTADLLIVFWMGKIKYYLIDFAAANEAFTTYLEGDDSTNIEALVTRGASRVNLNKYSEAIEDFDIVIELDKNNYFAYMNRGLAKAGLKKYEEALLDMDKAAEIKFDFSPIYINRALVKFQMGNTEGACFDLRKAQSLNNERADPMFEKYCPK